MVKLSEQLTDIVKNSKFLTEDVAEDEDRSLSTIDKSLDAAVEDSVNKVLENI